LERVVEFSESERDSQEQARIFGGLELVAAEETRSSAGGQHAQMAARADAKRARPRPAFRSRHRCDCCRGALLHGKPCWLEDSMGLKWLAGGRFRLYPCRWGVFGSHSSTPPWKDTKAKMMIMKTILNRAKTNRAF
jgi:hypothetical protein